MAGDMQGATVDAVDRIHSHDGVQQGDLGRRTGQDVPAMEAPLGRRQPGAGQLLQDLGQVADRHLGMLGDLLDGRGLSRVLG